MLTNRYRVRNEHVQTTNPFYVDYNSTGTQVGDSGPNHYGVIGYSGQFDSIADVTHSHYRKRRASGERIIGDLDLRKSNRTQSDASYDIYETNGSHVHVGGDVIQMVEQACPDPISISGDVNRARDLVLVNCYSKLRSAAIMSGEIIHDLDQTVGMLHRPFGEARKLLAQMARYRKRNLGKTIISAAKAARGAWLETRYGWIPTILDVRTIVKEAHEKRAKSSREGLVVRAGQSFNRSQSVEMDQVGGVPRSKGFRGSILSVKSASVSAGIMYDLASQTATQDLQRILGLRFHDVVPTAWEVVPYSFVVDCFVNIGDWLQAVTPVPGINISFTWVTSVVEDSCSWNAFPTCNANQTASGTLGSSEIYSNQVVRMCNPVVTWTPTYQIKPLGTLHCIDGLALSLKPIQALINSFVH